MSQIFDKYADDVKKAVAQKSILNWTIAENEIRYLQNDPFSITNQELYTTDKPLLDAQYPQYHVLSPAALNSESQVIKDFNDIFNFNTFEARGIADHNNIPYLHAVKRGLEDFDKDPTAKNYAFISEKVDNLLKQGKPKWDVSEDGRRETYNWIRLNANHLYSKHGFTDPSIRDRILHPIDSHDAGDAIDTTTKIAGKVIDTGGSLVNRGVSDILNSPELIAVLVILGLIVIYK